jgi:hypothetical protein
MSDSFEMLVDVEATPQQAEGVAREVLGRFRKMGLIACLEAPAIGQDQRLRVCTSSESGNAGFGNWSPAASSHMSAEHLTNGRSVLPAKDLFALHVGQESSHSGTPS